MGLIKNKGDYRVRCILPIITLLFCGVIWILVFERHGKESVMPNRAVVEVHSNNVDIVLAARAQIGVTTNYVADYRKIDYPNGDIPRGEGVCSDVVVRALRDARNLDLQELMHGDMEANFNKYPRKRKWLLARPDSNIDHRRVLNQECFFTREGWAVPVSTNRNEYLPGDFVTCRVYGLPHIMIVSDRKTRDGTPLVIHNIGGGTQEENALFGFQMTGHFRLPIQADLCSPPPRR